MTTPQRLITWPAGRFGKWFALIVGLVAVGALSPLASKLTSVSGNDASAWLPRTAEATAAVKRQQAAFPGADRLVAVVAYANDGGLTPVDRAKIEADRTAFAPFALDGQVQPVRPSEDGKAALVLFTIAGATDDDQANAVKGTIDRLPVDKPEDLRAAVSGSAGAVYDVVEAFSGLDSTLLFITAGVVALLLLITYRSPVLWLVPLITVGIASQLASAVVYLLARNDVITVNGQSQGILTVLVFGAGTDYALLLIARYREELRRNENRHTAMRIALGRSFPAILASAGTVAIGLLCLLAAQLNNIRGLGPVGAIGILSALVAMTTVLPALLVVGGRWLFWPFVPRFDPGAQTKDIASEHGIWNRVANLVGRRPRLIWVGTTMVLAALALGMLGLKTGQPADDQFTKTVGSVTGQRLISAHFPAGASNPVDIIAATPAADAVATAAKVDGISQVLPGRTSQDGKWVQIQAILADDPSSAAAKHTIDVVRDAVHKVPGGDALVGGQTAILVDTENAADHDNKVVLPLILGVVFVILVLLLRALVAPLLLVASVVLSFAASMGIASLIYRAIGHPRIDLGLPLLAFLFLVALGVDYTIFLMTRAREETAKLGHREGITHALAVTGGVITSAGLVLAATFAVLAVLPLVTMLQLGLVVALGVLLDTLVVRTLLVPALSLDVGRRIWWPSRLARPDHQTPQAAAGNDAEMVRTGR